ncbi:carbon-nitrogen hydrolase family protein [Aureimonas frigidaquae]|uniref:carbon-nitrogen hydrolase family protein n=1 Tax=Aureimonas frigidaquae TaxID=424757 RepID=UPI000781E37C|nr:carbon-nitrogen hydrolase family protein [Aureimonas frigidaquae]
MTAACRVAALSIGPSHGEATPLLDEAEAGIAALAADGAQLVLLPELFAAPFFAADDPARWAGLAETLDGPTSAWARRVSTQTGAAILFGMMAVAGDGGQPHNAAVLAVPGAAPRIVQRKVHLPPRGDAAFGEADHFAPGNGGIAVFDHAGARYGVLICYDRRFPECWRAAARQDCDAILVLVGGPAADPPGQFEAELRTHARANAVYALAAARYGVEELTGLSHRHDGETLAVGPDGALLTAAGRTARLDIDRAALLARRTQNPTHRQLRLH